MKVIVRAKPIYVKCRHCESIIKVKPSEIHLSFENKYIDCPVCKNRTRLIQVVKDKSRTFVRYVKIGD